MKPKTKTLTWGPSTSPAAAVDLGGYWRWKWAISRMWSRMGARARRRERETSPWVDLGGEA